MFDAPTLTEDAANRRRQRIQAMAGGRRLGGISTIAEVASRVSQDEERWLGSDGQKAELMRRLRAGRSEAVGNLLTETFNKWVSGVRSRGLEPRAASGGLGSRKTADGGACLQTLAAGSQAL